MYESPARDREGRQIEEVLPAAVNATATSAKNESQRASLKGGELARRSSDDEPRMAVMRSGSPVGQIGTLPAPLRIGAAVLLVALAILAIVLL